MKINLDTSAENIWCPGCPNNTILEATKQTITKMVESKKAKQIFLSNGFDFAYADDLGNEIADGFYFTIGWKNLSGKRLLHNMLLFGLAGIPLSITGSSRQGIRICVSLLKEDQLCELNKRVIGLANFLNSLE